MKFTAKQIAQILDGEIEGSPEEEVSRLSKIEEGTKGSLTFLSNPKYNSYLYTTQASITIVNQTFQLEKQVSTTLIRVKDAYKSFSKLLEFYNQVKNNKEGREEPYYISESASIGKHEYIGAFSYIGNNCTFHSGCIIGSDGFGFTPNDEGELIKVPQTGNVIIEDNVDIGSSSTIDRATLGATIIRSGVKLDNQVQIAHNVEIGKNTAIAAQTGIAGSTKVGENCMIGGQVGISGHLNLGNNLKIQAQSGISKSLKDNEIVQGSPAFGYSDFNKSYVYFKNLPKIIGRINKIEKELNTQNTDNE